MLHLNNRTSYYPRSPPLQPLRPFWASREARSQASRAGRYRHGIPRRIRAWWCCHTTVVDKNGHLVTNLPREAFTVSKTACSSRSSMFKREDVPVSMGLIIDNSGSMRDKRAKVEAAALALVKDSNPRRRSLHRQLQRRGLPRQPARQGFHQRHQGDGRSAHAHRFARRHGHAGRHPHVHRPPEGEGAQGQESAGGGDRRQRQRQRRSAWKTW